MAGAEGPEGQAAIPTDGDISRDPVIDGMIRQEDEGKQGSVLDGVANHDDDKPSPDLPNELRFCYGVQRRSRGTVQHDFLEWTEHKAAHSDGHYTRAIASYKRWQRKTQPVPFAVVVRLEDLGREADVYARVANALTEVKVAARGRRQRQRSAGV
ncbi:MAG: hypothetical protein KF886_23545 [Candidatus Hydrogenedentes bacterium]|nr:hypothetical protein [Candidatus Hydrogenedentota bacterium]